MAQRLQPEIVSCGVSRGTRGVPCGVAWESAVRCAEADARVAPRGAAGVLRGARGAAGAAAAAARLKFGRCASSRGFALDEYLAAC